jgi:hypothetical protein
VAALEGNKNLKNPLPQEQQDSAGASALVEHPVYFVSTVLRDAQACYSMS